MILIPKYSNLIQVVGSVSLVLKDDLTGEIKDERYIPNIVTTQGKTFIAARIASSNASTPALMTHMGIGTITGNPTPAVGDTALGAEIVAATYTYNRVGLTQSSAAAIATYSATFAGNNPALAGPSTNGTHAVTEAAIFNASTQASTTTMLCRTVFPVVSKAVGDSLTITWQITIQ